MPYRLSAEDKNMITLEHICKTYRVARRNSGLSAAFASLFHREYETIHALEDISFHIREGEIVGYIGPNGAGKSSTIKIMSGILVPDSGQCHINGMNPWKQRKEYVKDIGVVFGQRSQLWWDVPVADSFELLKDIYRLSDQSYHRNLSYLIQLLDWNHHKDAGPPAFPWAANAVRTCCLPPSLAANPLSRRAHHRAGCRLKSCGPQYYPGNQQGPGHHHYPYHP